VYLVGFTIEIYYDARSYKRHFVNVAVKWTLCVSTYYCRSPQMSEPFPFKYSAVSVLQALHMDCHFGHLMTFYPTQWIRELLLLTACSRVLLDKLTGSQLVNKFPAFHETRRFITSFTTARHLTLSQTTELLAQVIRREKTTPCRIGYFILYKKHH
jgi:hypothetical protein